MHVKRGAARLLCVDRSGPVIDKRHNLYVSQLISTSLLPRSSGAIHHISMPPKAAPRGGARGRGRGRGSAGTARAAEVPAADPPEVKAESTVAAGEAGGKADAPAAESGVAATTEAQPDISISVSYVHPAVFGRVH
jgi:hypothetical protein